MREKEIEGDADIAAADERSMRAEIKWGGLAISSLIRNFPPLLYRSLSLHFSLPLSCYLLGNSIPLSAVRISPRIELTTANPEL